MATLIDIIGGIFVGGFLLLIALSATDTATTEFFNYNSDAIMQQNLAVIGLLKSAHQMLMENHLNTCFKNAIARKDSKKQQEMINEICINKFIKNNI